MELEPLTNVGTGADGTGALSTGSPDTTDFGLMALAAARPAAAQHGPRHLALAQLEVSLVTGLPDLLDELATEMAAISDNYATFMAEHRDIVLAAAEGTVRTLLEIAEDEMAAPGGAGQPAWDEGLQRSLFEEIGRMQWRQGIPVGTLLAAYQLGARITWRRLSQQALASSLPPRALAALAEAVFCFVDQLSTASAAGYLSEQSQASAARERSRDELVDLLLSDRSDNSAIQAAAVRASWPLPTMASVVFVEPDNDVGRDMVARLDHTCLPIRRPGLLGAVVPDPLAPGRRERLARALHGSRAVIGHPVRLEHLPASAVIAEVAARLQHEGLLTEDPVFVDQHLDAIIVNREPRLLEALCQRALEPLDHASPASQVVLRETLRCWLRLMGDRRAIAEELHVHPQTVRYRLGRLRELFGSDLDDPDARLRMTLALAWTP